MEGQANDLVSSPEQVAGEGIGSGDTGDLKAKIQEKNLTNGSEKTTNGISNHLEGTSSPEKSKIHSSSSKHHSSSSSSSKHRDSSSHKHRDGHSSSKDGHKSSSSKHGSGSSSNSKNKDGTGSSSHSKDTHGSSNDKHISSSSNHKHSSSDKHKHSSSSSSDKNKHSSSSSSDKNKHSSSSDKNKHSSSSSSDKNKHSSSSSGDKNKHSSSSSGDKNKHGSSSTSDKNKHSSSSSSDKHKSSSSDKHKDGLSSSKEKHRDDKHRSDKHKEKDRHKDGSSSSSKDKHRSGDKDRVKVKEETKERDQSPTKIKVEKISPVKIKEEKRDHSPTKLSSPMSSPRSDCERSRKTNAVTVKREPAASDDEDDTPLSSRVKKAPKHKLEESSDDEPLSARMDKVKKVKKEEKESRKRKLEDEDFKPSKSKKIKKEKRSATSSGTETTPKKKGGKRKKEVEEAVVWKWWEEEKKDDGVKWKSLEHKGPVFAPPYEPLPDSVKFYYDGKVMKLSSETEEVATFYGKMLDHDYTSKDVFNTNFFKDWKKIMTKEEREKLLDLKKCNFNEINDYFKMVSEQRKNRSKEEKLETKKANEKITEEYGFCVIDNHKEKIGNFRIEPPGLFRGRGEHPKQGMLKRRVQSEDIIINCSKDSLIPKAPPGHKWKEVRHDNQVTWLASWNENIQGQTKYIMLNAASKLKGEKDWNKYEVARKLHKCVDKIRANYYEDFKSKEMRIRQRAVALYFIDKLALRAGNEKEEGETADTVGCCSLRVEHTKLYEERDGKPYVVEFDFLGKDSIRYTNAVPVEKRVFKNLELFTQNKQSSDDLFDRLNTTILNKHLHDLMEGLTAKVFRTYNASRTLQDQLNILTNPDDTIAAKILSYNRANRAVAVLCNHQRAVPKTFAKSMQNMMTKIDDKKKTIQDAKRGVKAAKIDYKQSKSDKNRNNLDRKKKILERLEDQLQKLEVSATDRDENKDIALGTSKLNYLDPRISVAWCKKYDVPIEKIYNKTQREKFRWAVDMATADFTF